MNKSGNNVFLGSAVVVAIGASFCCILPVLSIALGVRAFGAAAFFEPLRTYLLVLAFAALVFGFYRTYFRREKCAEGETCATKPIGKINQLVLWIATVGIVGFALFPFYTGSIVSALGSSAAKTQNEYVVFDNAANKTIFIEVEGMTCDGCASHIDETLKKLPGVISSEASYKDKNVKVVYDSKQITLEKIKQAINEIGYVAK